MLRKNFRPYDNKIKHIVNKEEIIMLNKKLVESEAKRNIIMQVLGKVYPRTIPANMHVWAKTYSSNEFEKHCVRYELLTELKHRTGGSSKHPIGTVNFEDKFTMVWLVKDNSAFEEILIENSYLKLR